MTRSLGPPAPAGNAKGCGPLALRLILADQLSPSIPTLADIEPGDVVLLVEVAEETTYVRHHKQKIALLFAAMRHFAAELDMGGVCVDYVRLEDKGNTGSFTGEVARAAQRHRAGRVIVTEPGEYRVEQALRGWEMALGIPVHIRADTRFFCSRAEFAQWAGGKSSYRMEFFYREMRRRTGYLMDGATPVGGRWNFDTENRKRLGARVQVPPRRRFMPDAITQEVLALVARRFSDHFGDIENFGWATTRAEAQEALEFFIGQCLPLFGDYQDAMKAGEPFLFHAVLSPYINCGLLTPREVCEAVLAAYEKGVVPLNAAEGFLRQIIGWREYVRGLYWLRMPAYAQSNALAAHRPLPWFYWSGKTTLNCIAHVVNDTRRHAYAHHIQRLMVTGNFALIAGISPAEVEEWYLIVFADAYEWVELPNVHGMILFADGGVLGSKPYAASGAYIDRMSDYCRDCYYDPKIKVGDRACPFNLLYWHFMMANRAMLERNPRMAMPYRTLDSMAPGRRQQIAREAKAFLDSL